MCHERGWHFCYPRAYRASDFVEQLCRHTKGRHARRPFILEEWQADEILLPLFGEVRWSPEQERYVRRFRIAWIELARKNGKSEVLAAIALLLLVGDDEEGAEVYGCAKDRAQARKVYDVAARMVEMSPELRQRLRVNRHTLRIVDARTGSYYEVVPRDAGGNLGHNPHGVVFDEVLTQPDGDLWDAMASAEGTRSQMLMVAATTAGDDPVGFCKSEHDYCARVAEDPALDPYRFVWMRNTPMSADPWDEATWHHANPALGSFKSIESMRAQALEARNDPKKEKAFRQFQLNTWWSHGTTKWIGTETFAASAGMVVDEQLVGRRAFGGVDLSSVSDLTSVCWVFPTGTPDATDSTVDVVWRHFIPEAMLETLDDFTAGATSQWTRQGWLTVTEGDVIDTDALYAAIADDVSKFAVESIGLDRWNSAALSSALGKAFPKVTLEFVGQGYASMTEPMKLAEKMIKSRRFVHGGNPVAAWCFTSCDIKQDESANMRPIKPRRDKARYRVDAVPAAMMALDGWLRRPEPKKRPRSAGFA